MKLDTFFDKFELFADAPNAVQKMRELVLDLAVKGKLTDRDVAKEVVDSKYSKEPTTDVLPPNWRLLNFGKFCDIQGGNQPPKSQFSDTPKPGYVRMFQIRDLGERPVPTYISKESTNRFCRDGEILIGRYGASVGKIFWAQDGAYNVALAKFLYPVDALLPDFAFWVLKSDFFQSEIAGASRSAQAGFNKGDLASIDFPLPPLAEQKRIVAKVDELMALCDRLEAQQQQRAAQHSLLARAAVSRFADAPTPANLDFIFHNAYAITPADLRKTILTLAVQGKLVPQDPNDEPAENLMVKVEQKKEKWAGPIGEDEVPFQLPPSWTWFRLGEISSLKHGYAFSSEFFSSEPAPFVLTTPGNFYEQGGFRDRESKRKYYSGPVDPEFIFKPGDLIIPMTEQAAGLLGSPAFIPDDGRVYIHNQRLGKLSFLESIAPEFAFWFFNSEFFRGELARTCTGMKVRHTSPDRVLKVPFPVAPLDEQRRIVAKVDELMKLVDQLEQQLEASQSAAEHLMIAIVAELTAA